VSLTTGGPGRTYPERLVGISEHDLLKSRPSTSSCVSEPTEPNRAALTGRAVVGVGEGATSRCNRDASVPPNKLKIWLGSLGQYLVRLLPWESGSYGLISKSLRTGISHKRDIHRSPGHVVFVLVSDLTQLRQRVRHHPYTDIRVCFLLFPCQHTPICWLRRFHYIQWSGRFVRVL